MWIAFRTVIACLVLAASAWPACMASAAELPCSGFGCSVIGDDTEDRYSGVLLIPSDGYHGAEAVRHEAISCPGCSWKLTPACKQGADGADANCKGSLQTCPPGRTRFDVFRMRPEDPAFRIVGSACLGANTPRTPAELVPDVRDQFIEYVPAAHPSYQPPTGAIVNLPTVFASGQPSSIGRKTFDLGGFEIVLTADARWTWHFDKGVDQTFGVPGGAWPDKSVSYTYGQPGTRQVSVTTTWQGQFMVDGLGPFPVNGPAVSQTSTP